MKQDKSDDGGYGWVVVGSAFIVILLTGGIKFSFGLLLPVLINVFNEATAPVAAIGGTFLGSLALSAPFAGSLSDAFGRRLLTIVGTLIFSSGLFCSAFAPNMGVLYLTYGIVCGVGYGLMITAPLACVMEHFTKKRALAVGIAFSGAGIGTFVMNQLTNLFLHKYGWRGTFILLSGICLNGVACGLALPYSGGRIEHNKPNSHRKPAEEHCNESFKRVGTDQIDSDRSISNSVDKTHKDYVDMSGADSADKACKFSSDTEHVCSNEKLSDDSSREPTIASFDIHCPYIDDKDSLASSSVYSVAPANGQCVNVNKTDNKHDILNDKTCVGSTYKFACMQHVTFGVMFGNILTIMRDFECLCILLSCFSFGLGFFVPFSFLPKQVLSMGMDSQQETWLMSAIGIANTTFRLIFGWLGNKFYRKRGVMHGCIMLLISVSLSTSVFLTTFETKLIFACVYGALFGSYYAIVPVRLASKVSVENVGKMTGLFLCMMNGANVVGMPLAGWTIDMTGGYVVCSLLAGAESLIAVLFVILPQIRKYFCNNRYKVETAHL